jgi:large subunit ribosomal protein L13
MTPGTYSQVTRCIRGGVVRHIDVRYLRIQFIGVTGQLADKKLTKTGIDLGLLFASFTPLLIRTLMKTHLPKVNIDERKWHVIDANGAVLGRLAVQISDILRGKNKPIYTPHLDAGDFVVVINAEKVVVTGKKETAKEYMTYSGWKGGEKHRTVAQIRAKRPEHLITHAVRGMVPKNRLGRTLMTKLKVYKGDKHPHAAQQPDTVPAAK